LKTPISVNLKVTHLCNYFCRFCYGHFNNIPEAFSDSRILEIPGLLAEAGCRKLTFEGGEPFMYHALPEVLSVARENGLVTSVVTNGSLVTEDILSSMSQDLDWLGISLDSAREDVEKRLGRGNGSHVAHARYIATIARGLDIRLKINTVVTALNYLEDMIPLILSISPDRWKVFRLLQIEDQNIPQTLDISISKGQFTEFRSLNSPVEEYGIDVVFENREEMLGSYIMLLPDGRFLSNAGSIHSFSKHTIFEVGVMEDLTEVTWDQVIFLRRGGLYDWDTNKSKEVRERLKRRREDPLTTTDRIR
jgi:radical S-adenosyl methionine domain-containing protein 2